MGVYSGYDEAKGRHAEAEAGRGGPSRARRRIARAPKVKFRDKHPSEQERLRGDEDNDMEMDTQNTYKEITEMPKKSRFYESLKSELGDLEHSTGKDGPILIISEKYLARMNEQLERVVVVKLMGRPMGYKMLCNII
ncbi:hypothetical protein Scep_002646 [Stephania cephalantha]|uniref:Uncharacterized protein n=1 Tax=Stephania cephalantha TaxID=152367 RepID=A0AAP0Q4T7_9MAGN